MHGNAQIAIVAVIGAVVIVGIVLASPLFYETTVDEPLPTALNKVQEGLTYTTFVKMDDAERSMLVEKIPEKTKEMIMKEAEKSSTNVSEGMNEIVKDESPTISKIGEFRGLAGHQASGKAELVLVGDAMYLRFEDFQVTNGPDLRVYITKDGNVKDGIHLEKLKGSTGNQNYELPDTIDTDIYNTVVIYCQPFGVYFGDAKLG